MSELNRKIKQAPESFSPKVKPEIISMAERSQQNNDYPIEFILPDKSMKIPPEVKHYGPAYFAPSNEFAHFLDYSGQGYGLIFDGDWCKDRNYTIAEVFSGHATQPVCMECHAAPEGQKSFWELMGFPYCQKFFADSTKENYMNEQDMKDMIKYALCTLGQPVIIPQSGYFTGSIVIGYKDNGNVLVVYRYLPYFMDMENNAQPITGEIKDWYNNDTSLFIAGKREKALSLFDIYKEGSHLIHEQLAENIRSESRHYYDEWESFLRMSKDEMIEKVKCTKWVPGGELYHYNKNDDTDENVWKLIYESHNNTWCIMAEARFYVMNFFGQMNEFFPELKEELKELENHFYYTQDIMGSQYNKEIEDPVKPDVFENQDVRNRMADCVKRFREADEKGLEMVESFLTKDFFGEV